MTFALWGCRARDVQIGSAEDRSVCRRARIMAALRREVRRTQFPTLLTPRVTSGYRVGDSVRFEFE